ncbi:MAG: M1 family metallopeptidase [Chitinophagaceae bacterium]|nr:M1 family metallopeptidase [Chitinophagaceae bacterium]
MKLIFLSFILGITLSSTGPANGQPLQKKRDYSRQDTLRGSLTSERVWWDVLHYNIEVNPDYLTKTIQGRNIITYRNIEGGKKMQIDLQQPMQIDSVHDGEGLKTELSRDGNLYYITWDAKQVMQVKKQRTITLYFSGKPKEAVNPPWDGGWIWKKDNNGNPWMSVACQGLGASVWYPCKDHQSDEPDSASITIITPDTLTAVSNGRLAAKKTRGKGITSWTWQLKNPVNSYNIVPYIGKYANFSDIYNGENGKLDLNYWCLDYNLGRAKSHLEPQVKAMLKCFEYWFGPYPFYSDGYKLVEAPHLGMEHQSAIAYGNGYKMGYNGKDWSGTGQGLKWDFIVVHESGHEWFGNSITAKDIADMWLHEGFTSYSETLFTECQSGKKAAQDYVTGVRKVIQNDIPLIGDYGVNQEGSGDMYCKGANLIHILRQVINDDEKFRKILRGLNKRFYHQEVSTKDIETFISTNSKIDFSKIFDQYLRTTQIPKLEYKIKGGDLTYRWINCVKGFNLPLKVTFKGERWIRPTEEWQVLSLYPESIGVFTINQNFYINSVKVN